MKRGRGFALFLTLSFILVSCETTGPKTKQGAVGGGLIGAAAGGIIGHQSGHGLEGAGIGAAVGALSGALIGSSMDQMDRRALATNPEHLTIVKIAEMGREGVPEAVILSEIQRTRSTYHLNSEIITYLKQNKVSDRVIDYMLLTIA